MNPRHLTMPELIAVRDTDRSEPSFAGAHRHVEECPACRAEVDRLHQRVALMRALPTLAPSTNVFPAVRRHLREVRVQKYWRTAATVSITAAASLVIWIVGHNLAAPPPLSAEAEIADVKSSTMRIEDRLKEWAPKLRALDGGTVIVVLQLEDRIADVDRQLHQIDGEPQKTIILELPINRDSQRLHRQLKLWREREGLMSALLKVHLNRTAKIDL